MIQATVFEVLISDKAGDHFVVDASNYGEALEFARIWRTVVGATVYDVRAVASRPNASPASPASSSSSSSERSPSKHSRVRTPTLSGESIQGGVCRRDTDRFVAVR
jgi:hypothetical protein